MGTWSHPEKFPHHLSNRYVFDGKPPDLKSGELVKRKERRQEAEKELEKAKEAGDTENVQKFERRLVRATPQHNEDCKKLLKLMGIPYVEVSATDWFKCDNLAKTSTLHVNSLYLLIQRKGEPNLIVFNSFRITVNITVDVTVDVTVLNKSVK